MNHFGQSLKEIRQHKRMSQRKLAEKIGVDFTYISKIENGVQPPPSEETILRIAEVFEEDKVDWIFLSGRIPQCIQDFILKEPRLIELLKKAPTLTEEQWCLIENIVHEKEREAM